MLATRFPRRTFLKYGLQVAGGLALSPSLLAHAASRLGSTMKKFEISLAAWSVHRMFYSGKLKQIDLPELCRTEFDLGGLELVNSFFPSPQYTYCKSLLKRAHDHGVKILLIMCDGEGDLAHPDKTERRQAVRNHRKWLDVAQVLGCHSIRCNAGHGKPGDKDTLNRCAESFAELVEIARPDKINIIIENHGGLSSDPDSLPAVIKKVNDPLLGTLPDFGNFPKNVDRYDAVRKMMPYAKAVSAKCHDFDDAGNEINTDYARMMRIVLEAGYTGWVGIEYEGKNMDEIAGVKACKRLLERFRRSSRAGDRTTP
ncbi:MAG: sugar phosphate isomerase/epimerase [Phycisphaerae bacterium]|nr:sugar phosphate isomerase/epimerase [Phycisphaerae bacterium]